MGAELSSAFAGSLRCLALVLMLANFTTSVRAAEARLVVSAVVPKQARLMVLGRPSKIEVTSDDIAKGYVEVRDGMSIVVRSNSPEGYLLQFDSQSGFLGGIEVSESGRMLQFGPAGGSAVIHGSERGSATSVLQLSFRFMLARSATVGAYPWPLQVSVIPR